MKLLSFMKHLLGILFPFLVCLSIYGIFIGGTAMTGNGENQPLESEKPVQEAEELDALASAFNQVRIFSDAEFQEAVSLYETGLPGFSPRIGSRVSIPSSSSRVSDSYSPSSARSILVADASEKKNSSDSSAKKSESETSSSNSGNVSPKNADAKAGNTDASVKTAPETLSSPPPAWSGTRGDIWRIDTTFASRTSPALSQMRKLKFYRWEDSQWMKAAEEDFFASTFEDQPLIFYVHGNRTELNTAAMQGIATLKNHARHFPDSTPARLVIWNWDAEKIAVRPRVDFPAKANFADFQGFYLAEIIENLPAKKQIILVGHSFGARTILSSLHLLAGKTFRNRTLAALFPNESAVSEVSWKKETVRKDEENVQTLPKIDVLLVASAISCDVLSKGGMFSGALETVSCLRVTQNPSDHALKYYPVMKGARNRLPEAMGAIGPVLGNVAPELREKVQVIPLDNPTHQYLEYISMRSVQNALKF